MSNEAVELTLSGIYPAGVLADRHYPPLKSYVDGLIVEGLGVLGGKPKLGKSWLVAGLAVAAPGLSQGTSEIGQKLPLGGGVTVAERLLTLAEVAELLRVAEATLYRQRYVGEPPGSLGFRLGGFVRFRPSDIEAWLDQLHQGSNGEGRDNHG